MLAADITAEIFVLLMVLVRVGAAIMILPGIGDGMVSPRIRLILAVVISFLVTPVVGLSIPPAPDNPLALFALIIAEVLIGLFIGLLARLLLTAVDVAGMIISFNMSLANAFVFNPGMTSQGSLPSAFLTILALTLIFVTDLHHLMILAITDSYEVFPAGQMLPIGDAADTVARFVARAFRIGVQLAAPFIIIGLVFYVAVGVLARLMPQVQIFFIAIPIQLMLGLVVFALMLSAGMLYWLAGVQDSLVGLIDP